MHKLVQRNLIKINDRPNYEEPNFKPPWYNENDKSEFHKIKGHTTNNYMRLKNIVEDLIENGEVDVEPHIKNKDLKIYKDPIPNHSRGITKGKNKFTIRLLSIMARILF